MSTFLEIIEMNIDMVVTFLVGILVFLLYNFLKYALKRHFLSKQLPGSQPGFFDVLGDLREVARLRKISPQNNFNVAILKFIGDRANRFRKNHISCCWVSFVPFVTIFTAKGFEDMISGTRANEKGWIYKFFHPWLGTGLLTSFGPKWKSRRKLLTPSFHFDILKDFLPIFNEQARKFIKTLEHETTKDYTDIIMPITLCTLDIACETILGVKINAVENGTSEYVMAVSRSTNIIAERMINIRYWIDFIFQFTKEGKQFKKDLKLLHDFTRSVIKEKKQRLLSGESTIDEKKKRKALIDVLIEYHVRMKKLSEEDIREELDTFAFAGHDTTSMGICWAMYLIGLHPDVQDKLHEEIDRIFSDDTERPITTDDLKDMTFLECVLKESQRLYPPVPFIAREATEDIEIHGYKIPKGTQCIGVTYQIHRDESVFPDPEKFDPDRFLPENRANRHPFAFIPFSAGPRNCIGQRFAVMEEKVLIASILKNFTIESLDSRDHMILAPEIILRSLNPIRIRIRSRHH